jgi:hypothetical protein
MKKLVQLKKGDKNLPKLLIKLSKTKIGVKNLQGVNISSPNRKSKVIIVYIRPMKIARSIV